MEEKIEAIKEVILGACAGCMMLDSTIKDGVEQILVEEVPGVIEVQAI